MADISKLYLQDFAAFEALGEISALLDVEIVLHGGAAFRAALYSAFKKETDVDIFDYAPFSSDIDIEHSGTSEQTPIIRRYINRLVPFASWCRWAINDRDRASEARVRRSVSTQIPLRQIRWSTATPAYISKRAARDIADRRVSFSRNAKFGKVPDGHSVRPDLELNGLLLALNTWTEAQEISGKDFSFDRSAALSWIKDSTWEIAKVSDDPIVCSRFWHLLSSRLARGVTDDFSKRLFEIGAPMLKHFDVGSLPSEKRGSAISVSKYIGRGHFRCPVIMPKLLKGDSARNLFVRKISEAARLAGCEKELPPDKMTLIDPCFKLIGIVDGLRFHPYRSHAVTAFDDPYLSEGETSFVAPGTLQEFIQVAWRTAASDQIDAHRLTGQVVLLDGSGKQAPAALPVVGGTFGKSRAWLRAAVSGYIDSDREVEAMLLILQARQNAGMENHGVSGRGKDDSYDENLDFDDESNDGDAHDAVAYEAKAL